MDVALETVGVRAMVEGKEEAELRSTTTRARRLLHRTIKRHRKVHWDTFLDDSDNLGKAAKYLDSLVRLRGLLFLTT